MIYLVCEFLHQTIQPFTYQNSDEIIEVEGPILYYMFEVMTQQKMFLKVSVVKVRFQKVEEKLFL